MSDYSLPDEVQVERDGQVGAQPTLLASSKLVSEHLLGLCASSRSMQTSAPS